MDNIPQDPIPVLRAVNSRDACLCVFLAGKGDINTNRLLVLSIFPGFTDNDLNDFAVLSEVIRPAEGVQQPVFPYGGSEAGHVYEVLLDNAQAGEVLAAEGVGLGLLGFLLPNLGVLLGLLCDLLLVLGHPVRC
jgi:hypothetical protein